MSISKMVSWPTWRKKYFGDWRIKSGPQPGVAARCKLCVRKEIVLGSDLSYTNFLRHLRKIHGLDPSNKKDASDSSPKQSTIEHFVSPHSR